VGTTQQKGGASVGVASDRSRTDPAVIAEFGHPAET